MMSKGVILQWFVMAQATILAYGEGEIVSEMDMVASLGEENNGSWIEDPRLFKVIGKDSEGQFSVDEGWKQVSDEDTLLYDEQFLDHFLSTPALLEDFEKGDLAFVEGTEPIHLSMSGPDNAQSGSVINFNCQSPALRLFYPKVELEWQITNYSGDSVEFSIFTINDSPDAGDEMISEVTVTADKEDMMLTVQCSLGSEDLFSIDKFMQFDVQYLPSEVNIAGAEQLQVGVEKMVKCRTDESYPASKLLWRANGMLVEEGVNSSIEYTDSGAMEAWSSLFITPESAGEVTVTCEVEGQEEVLRDEKIFKVNGKCWELLLRENSDKEFLIPQGFQFVDINDNNFQTYAAQVEHLVTSEVSEQMTNSLAGFAKSSIEEHCMIEDDIYVFGPQTVEDGEEVIFRCMMNHFQHEDDLSWKVTSFSGADISFKSVDFSSIQVSASKHHKILNIKCSDSEVETESKIVTVKYKPSRLKIEGPKQVTPSEENVFDCSTNPSFPGVNLMWRLNGKPVEDGVVMTTKEQDGSTVSLSSLSLSVDSTSSQATIICFVEGNALELQAQKLVKIIGGQDDKKEEGWQIVVRETVDDEYKIPAGFILVDINEKNFRNYVSRINHLITDEISGKMAENLVGFIKFDPDYAVPEEEVGTDLQQTVLTALSCLDSKYQCCPDLIHPQHGYQAYGCCSSSQYGCCPDNITPAPAPFFDGCDCASYAHGCCPDKLTPAEGPNLVGCGCQYSEFGCCLDQQTQASGQQYEGCGCDTFQFGCCPDGVSMAQGPNIEGCNHCSNYEYGCCEDEITPAYGPNMEGCGCESSRYGCCLEGGAATGPNYMGCLRLPGENCHLPSETGSCTNYIDKWFFDMNYGGCSRFWYGGCEPGKNHFETEDDCKHKCSEPRGSAVCFLQKVEGPCKGSYEEWYYDAQMRSCRQFRYGGCLGNGNRFLTKKDCEGVCQPKESEPVCKKPKAEGACDGEHPRWFYNSLLGDCEEFSYSGCMGNNNRFMNQEECKNTCKHSARARKSEVTCKQYIEEGSCEDGMNSTLARWGYHPYSRRCVPFYYSGCTGNENNFESQEECEVVCPTTFSPLIQLPDGKQLLFMRGQSEGQLAVSVRANPAPTAIWRHNGREISKYDSQYSVLDDFSLLISNVGDHNGGTYTFEANNGIGETPAVEIEVVIYPILPSISMVSEKNIFAPKTDVTLECKIKGYPPPTVQWFKKLHRQRELPLESDGIGVAIDTFQETTTDMVSRLLLRSVDEDDTATYRCQAGSATKSSAVSVQYGPGEMCVDNPSFRQCKLVVRNKFCANKYYGKFCCR